MNRPRQHSDSDRDAGSKNSHDGRVVFTLPADGQTKQWWLGLDGVRPCFAAMLSLLISAGPGWSLETASGPKSQVTGKSPTGSGELVPTAIDSTPWYDSERRQIVPIYLEPRQDDSINRDSRWLPKPKTLKKSTSTTSSGSGTTAGGGAGTGLFGSGITLGNLFGWALLLAIVIGIVGAIIFAVSRAELNPGESDMSKARKNANKDLPDEQTLERIKHLPPELRRTDVNLRTECERLMHECLFEQAIILLLGHQLLLLDRNGLIRLGRGKTNGKYVREARASHDQCATWLRATADAFEQSYFGRHEIPAEVFAELWGQNQELESTAKSFGDSK